MSSGIKANQARKPSGAGRKATPSTAPLSSASEVPRRSVEPDLFTLLGGAVNGIHQLHDREDLLGGAGRLHPLAQHVGEMRELRVDRVLVLIARGLHGRRD